jgi:hypothetical protein
MVTTKEALNQKEHGGERVSRLLRNLNVIGAVALGGVGLAFNSALLTSWGVLNAGQAGLFEATRRWSKSKNHPKTPLR